VGRSQHDSVIIAVQRLPLALGLLECIRQYWEACGASQDLASIHTAGGCMKERTFGSKTFTAPRRDPDEQAS
jgi:hypothetical protein